VEEEARAIVSRSKGTTEVVKKTHRDEGDARELATGCTTWTRGVWLSDYATILSLGLGALCAFCGKNILRNALFY